MYNYFIGESFPVSSCKQLSSGALSAPLAGGGAGGGGRHRRPPFLTVLHSCHSANSKLLAVTEWVLHASWS